MATAIEKLKAFNDLRKRRKAMKIFMVLYKDPKSTMEGILQEAAFKMAREMFMRMLDAEGFAHCFMCPKRGPLKKLAQTGTLLCDVHHAKAMEEHDKLKSTQKKETINAPRDEARQS